MFSPLQPLVRGWRAALPLVVVALLAPGRAEARCGHPGSVFKSDLITASEPGAPRANEAPTSVTESAPAPDKPCDGPNCSERQDRNAPAPSVAPTAPRGAEAVLNIGTEHPGATRGSFARDDSSPDPIDRTSAIFHPPRSA